MTGDTEGVLAEVAGQAKNVRFEAIQVVAADAGWFAAEVIAALVRGDDVEAGRRQGPDLASPAIPELGESMEKKHDGAFRRAGLGDMKFDAVRSYAGKSYGLLRHTLPEAR